MRNKLIVFILVVGISVIIFNLFKWNRSEDSLPESTRQTSSPITPQVSLNEVDAEAAHVSNTLEQDIYCQSLKKKFYISNTLINVDMHRDYYQLVDKFGMEAFLSAFSILHDPVAVNRLKLQMSPTKDLMRERAKIVWGDEIPENFEYTLSSDNVVQMSKASSEEVELFLDQKLIMPWEFGELIEKRSLPDNELLRLMRGVWDVNLLYPDAANFQPE